MKEISKSQTIRLIDVFIIGPFLIYASNQTTLNDLSKKLLLFFGIATIIYNAKNYLANLKAGIQ